MAPLGKSVTHLIPELLDDDIVTVEFFIPFVQIVFFLSFGLFLFHIYRSIPEHTNDLSGP